MSWRALFSIWQVNRPSNSVHPVRSCDLFLINPTEIFYVGPWSRFSISDNSNLSFYNTLHGLIHLEIPVLDKCF